MLQFAIKFSLSLSRLVKVLHHVPWSNFAWSVRPFVCDLLVNLLVSPNAIGEKPRFFRPIYPTTCLSDPSLSLSLSAVCFLRRVPCYIYLVIFMSLIRDIFLFPPLSSLSERHGPATPAQPCPLLVFFAFL